MIFTLYSIIFFLSLSVICFEILATRVTSVIFVSDYAYIILSLAILGLGCGAVLYSTKLYQRLQIDDNALSRLLLIYGFTLCMFIVVVCLLSVTNPFIYFILILLPFLIAGVIYAYIYKLHPELSFKIYAADLTGAASGSLIPLFIINTFTVPNSILIAGIFICIIGSVLSLYKKKKLHYLLSAVLFICLIALLINGKNEILSRIPIGKYPEKDFYYVYSDENIQKEILESRWSIYGRSDLVRYNNQDFVWHLFIDGAAGSPMYRFDGNVKQPSRILLDQLVHETTTTPFICFQQFEKDSILIIGPGGGRDVLIALLSDVKNITGVEINPDFVNLVKDYSDFNGGIYTNFPNVNIKIQEGRNFVKHSKEFYDIILLALPSTEQLQNIDALAANENYLLTKESIFDYLRILNSNGYLIFTLHNDWEVIKLIVTAISAFEEQNISVEQALKHFAVVESEINPPTLIIKKEPFNQQNINHWLNSTLNLPASFPHITFLSKNIISERKTGTRIQKFMQSLIENDDKFYDFIKQHPLNLNPALDDNPYFYNLRKGIPVSFKWLITGIAAFNVFLMILFIKNYRKEKTKVNGKNIFRLFVIFALLGAGFMMIEISLFQKLILFLGAPTVSLSILLSSLLIGMGIGSYAANKYFLSFEKALLKIIYLIIVYDVLLFLLWIWIFNTSFIESYLVRILFIIVCILPLGFLLGIPFPSFIRKLESADSKNFIPWMYGINGTMSVLGYVLFAVVSMLFGFTVSFYIGLTCYLVIAIILKRDFKSQTL